MARRLNCVTWSGFNTHNVGIFMGKRIASKPISADDMNDRKGGMMSLLMSSDAGALEFEESAGSDPRLIGECSLG